MVTRAETIPLSVKGSKINTAPYGSTLSGCTLWISKLPSLKTRPGTVLGLYLFHGKLGGGPVGAVPGW